LSNSTSTNTTTDQAVNQANLIESAKEDEFLKQKMLESIQ